MGNCCCCVYHHGWNHVLLLIIMQSIFKVFILFFFVYTCLFCIPPQAVLQHFIAFNAARPWYMCVMMITISYKLICFQFPFFLSNLYQICMYIRSQQIHIHMYIHTYICVYHLEFSYPKGNDFIQIHAIQKSQIERHEQWETIFLFGTMFCLVQKVSDAILQFCKCKQKICL